MQILSGSFIEQAGVPVIGVHRSFLPGFTGAGPHAGAGVELTGATALTVTSPAGGPTVIEAELPRA